jgi:hypothetical protein
MVALAAECMNGDVVSSFSKAFATIETVEDIKADIQSTNVSPGIVNATETAADVALITTNTNETAANTENAEISSFDYH